MARLPDPRRGRRRPGARLFLRLLALLACGLPVIVQAQSSQFCSGPAPPPALKTAAWGAPMHYRSAQNNGQTVLIAEGEIKEGEGIRLAQALNASRPAEVWLHSPGGVAVEGTAMGRELRRRRLLVRVPNGAICFSACSLAFLGGEVRVIDPEGYYGVHAFAGASRQFLLRARDDINRAEQAVTQAVRQGRATPAQIDDAWSYVGSRIMGEFQRGSAQLAADQARYLVEMSLSLELLTDLFGTPFTSACYLTRAGLQRYNIVNSD